MWELAGIVIGVLSFMGVVVLVFFLGVISGVAVFEEDKKEDKGVWRG